jgi:hypothetical protein
VRDFEQKGRFREIFAAFDFEHGGHAGSLRSSRAKIARGVDQADRATRRAFARKSCDRAARSRTSCVMGQAEKPAETQAETLGTFPKHDSQV